MKNLHNWFKVVDKLVISVAEVLEFLNFFLKELEDVIGGLAILEFLCKWILRKIYSGELAIVSQGCIENDIEVEVRRGDYCRGHGTEKAWLRGEMEGGRDLRFWNPSQLDPRAYSDFLDGEVVSVHNDAQ